MTTLVTGSTGLLGNNLVRILLERGERVRVLVRESSDPRPLAGLDVERCVGDVRSFEEVRRAAEGVACVYHSAAFVHIGKTQLELSRAINATGSRYVAIAAREAGARMVHVSTVDTLGVGQPGQLADEDQQYGDKYPTSYSISKCEAESVVEAEVANGLDAVIVHPGFLVGPWDWKPSSGRMMLAVAQTATPLAPAGGHAVGDVRDVANGMIAAAAKGGRGEHYILGGHSISYFDFWRLCAEVCGGRGPVGRLGPVNRAIVATAGDFWTRIAGREADINSASIGISCQFHYYSSAKAERELGYTVRPLKTSLEDAWQWFCEHGYAQQPARGR